MSEQQQADPNNPQTNDLEQTQPTEDILSALNALTNVAKSSNSQPPTPSVPAAPSRGASQDVQQQQQQQQQQDTQQEEAMNQDEPESQPESQQSRAPTEQASAPSEWQQLREKLREHPLDPDGWARLVDLAESAGELEQIKATYEALLETYPNTASAQIAYINHYLSPGLFSYAEELFKRFLRTSPIVELWKFYLTYVRRINTTPNSRENIRLAYEFALNRIGHDKDSGEIWNDYVQFIKSGNTTNTWEEQQKMDALRKVYHRAVQIPLENVEKLWSELETFESGLNKITAKKFMSDLSPAHMQARTVLRQLQRHLGPLFPPGPTSSSSAGGGKVAQNLPAAPTFTAGERALVGSWKAYLKWEESNPLEIEDKERATFIGRVQQVYKKAVIRMRFFSEVWYMSFVWTNSIGKHEEAVNILKAGIESNPRSFLLNFAYAEVLENREQYTEVAAIYDKLLELLRIELESLEARASSSTNTSLSSSQEYAPPTNGYNMNGSMASIGTQPADESGGKDKEKDKDKGKSKELAERRSEFGLVWTMYIRFARRAHDLKTFRSIFQRARRDRWTPWEVYEAAALMEYHCTKEGGAGVASRIFEKGLESFGDEVEFVLRYLGFLISVNDDNNARALFERVITTFTPDKARPLWERWARYEYQFGDLKAAQALEKRIAEVYPNDPPIKRFAQRHTYLGIDAIAARDLGFAMAASRGTANQQGSQGQMGTALSALSIGPSQSSQSLDRGRTESTVSIGGGDAHPHGGDRHGHGAPQRAPPGKRASSPDYTLGGTGSAAGTGGGGGPSGGGGAGGGGGGRRGRGGGDDFGPPSKRQRPTSPPGRDRDHGGGGGGGRRRFNSPLSRDRASLGGAGPGGPAGPVGPGGGGPSGGGADWGDRRGGGSDKDAGGSDKGVQIPGVLSWFVGQLPAPSAFDGPVFRTDDLMNLLRNAVIPNVTRRPPSPPPPPRGGGRPPPDYSPYTGPSSGRPGGGARRY